VVLYESNPALKGGVATRNAAGLEPLPRLPLKNPGVNAGVSSHGMNTASLSGKTGRIFLQEICSEKLILIIRG